MTKKVSIPEIKNYLVFRYNLYMIEYMYEYIVERLIAEYPIEDNPLMKDVFGKEKKEFLYKMLNTNRTDFSKYKHSDKEEKTVTKQVRAVFREHPEFEPFITGEKLIVDYAGEEEYPNEHELQLSEKIEDALRRSVDNVWKLVHDKLSFDQIRNKGIVLEIAGWMVIKISEQYLERKNKEEKIDNIVLREFSHIDKISFEMLDMCDLRTIETMLKSLKEFQGKANSIYNYKRMKGD